MLYLYILYINLHRRSTSVNHVVTSVASDVSNCNTHNWVFHSKTTGKEYKIFCNVNCKTPNVVYLLDCHVCGSQYVGESVQPFNKRMNGHRSDLTKKTLLFVSQHFVSPGHSLAVSKSGNPGPGPVPKTRAQIRIFFITSLLRH
jgi:hypothetical protein